LGDISHAVGGHLGVPHILSIPRVFNFNILFPFLARRGTAVNTRLNLGYDMNSF
jgi:hypothetical protein